MRYRRTLIPTVVAVCLLALSAALVLAANPRMSAKASLGSPTLKVDLTETGMGNNPGVTIVSSANVSGKAGCANDYEHPPIYYSWYSGVVSTTIWSDKNGNVTAQVLLPGVPDGFCHYGNMPVIKTVTFSNVTVTDTTNGVSASVPGTFTFNAP